MAYTGLNEDGTLRKESEDVLWSLWKKLRGVKGAPQINKYCQVSVNKYQQRMKVRLGNITVTLFFDTLGEGVLFQSIYKDRNELSCSELNRSFLKRRWVLESIFYLIFTDFDLLFIGKRAEEIINAVKEDAWETISAKDFAWAEFA